MRKNFTSLVCCQPRKNPTLQNLFFWETGECQTFTTYKFQCESPRQHPSRDWRFPGGSCFEKCLGDVSLDPRNFRDQLRFFHPIRETCGESQLGQWGKLHKTSQHRRKVHSLAPASSSWWSWAKTSKILSSSSWNCSSETSKPLQVKKKWRN